MKHKFFGGCEVKFRSIIELRRLNQNESFQKISKNFIRIESINNFKSDVSLQNSHQRLKIKCRYMFLDQEIVLILSGECRMIFD